MRARLCVVYREIACMAASVLAGGVRASEF